MQIKKNVFSGKLYIDDWFSSLAGIIINFHKANIVFHPEWKLAVCVCVFLNILKFKHIMFLQPISASSWLAASILLWAVQPTDWSAAKVPSQGALWDGGQSRGSEGAFWWPPCGAGTWSTLCYCVWASTLRLVLCTAFYAPGPYWALRHSMFVIWSNSVIITFSFPHLPTPFSPLSTI